MFWVIFWGILLTPFYVFWAPPFYFLGPQNITFYVFDITFGRAGWGGGGGVLGYKGGGGVLGYWGIGGGLGWGTGRPNLSLKKTIF